MMGKGKNKKKATAKGGGGAGSSGGGGGDFELLKDPVMLRTVYTEPLLQKLDVVEGGKLIPPGWLESHVVKMHEAWRDFLPRGVEAADLKGRTHPQTPSHFRDLQKDEGIVTVDLQARHLEKGLVRQLKAASEASLILEEEHAKETKVAKEQFERLAARMSAWEARDAARGAEVEALKADFEASKADFEASKADFEASKARDAARGAGLEAQVAALRRFCKRGLELSNMVKRRVALSLARKAVEQRLGRPRGDESWFAYFRDFTPGDWVTVGIDRTAVQNLLAGGALDLNNAIHVIPAESVVGSIVNMQHGPLRTMWEDIFFLAFRKRVADTVFEENEVAYEAQILGD